MRDKVTDEESVNRRWREAVGKHEKIITETNQRYAAVVEALRLAERYINDGSALPTDKNHPYYKVSEAIEKALSDLDQSAPQDAKE